MPRTEVSVVVPFRDEDGSRTPQWQWVERRWRALLPDAEIVIGTDTGQPFSKTTAVNDGVKQAAGEIIVCADADTWVEQDPLLDAIEQAHARSRLVVPWSAAWRLSLEHSADMMSRDPATARRPDQEMLLLKNGPGPHTAAMCWVLRRWSFDKVNGMDPRFRGWGWEDISFRRQCDALLSKTRYLEGGAYALHHHVSYRDAEGAIVQKTADNQRRLGWDSRVWGASDQGHQNRTLTQLYSWAEKNPEKMQWLASQHPLGGEPEPVPDKRPSFSKRSGKIKPVSDSVLIRETPTSPPQHADEGTA